MIAVPAAFTLQTGKDHWQVLLRARAIENQAFVFARPVRFPRRQAASYGHALIVDPWGVVLAECGDREGFAWPSWTSTSRTPSGATCPA